MITPNLVAVTLVVSAMTGLSYADPDRPERIHENIRTEYRGAATPDHIMFAHELFTIREAAVSYPDYALRIVQEGMQLDSEEAAEAFIARMVAAAGELESEYGKVSDTLLCGPDAPRAREALYKILDRVDDLREIKDHNAYVKFTSSLDKSQKDALSAWLEEDKEGFYYRTAEHKSSYEGTGVDVVRHVETVCAMRASLGLIH